MDEPARSGGAESERDLVDLAPVYALDAVDDAQRRDIDILLGTAEPRVREQFESAVRSVRQTMAEQSASTALKPPEYLFERILSRLPEASAEDLPKPVSLEEHRVRRRNKVVTAVSAAAAAVVIAMGGVIVGQQLVSKPGEPVPAQVLAADDVRTSVAPIAGGGSATVMFSEEVNAGVLVMNDVQPPAAGSVYQMWLLGPSHEPVSAGIMDAAAVAPSTTAVVTNIDQSTALGFSVEPSGGSTQPTGEIFATVALD